MLTNLFLPHVRTVGQLPRIDPALNLSREQAALQQKNLSHLAVDSRAVK